MECAEWHLEDPAINTSDSDTDDTNDTAAVDDSRSASDGGDGGGGCSSAGPSRKHFLSKAWTLPLTGEVSGSRFTWSFVRLIVMSLVYVLLSLFGFLFMRNFLLGQGATGDEFCQPGALYLRLALVSWLGAVPGLVVLGLFAYLQKSLADRSALIADVERYLVLVWMYFMLLAGRFLTRFFSLCQRKPEERFQESTAFVVAVRVVSAALVLFYTRAMEKRVSFIQKRFGKQSFPHAICVFRWAILSFLACRVAAELRFYLTASTAAEHADILRNLGTFSTSMMVAPVVCIGASSLVLAALVVKAFAEPLCTTAAFATPEAGIYTMAEACWSHRILRRVRHSMVIPLVLFGIGELAKAGVVMVWHSTDVANFVLVWQRVLLMLVEAVCLLPMLGLCQEQHPQLPKATGHSLLASAACAADDGCDRHTATWTAKVRDLAGRSISVDALLSFHGGLRSPTVMPSYDPWNSTTNDVVRQAIIPLSRRGGSTGGMAYSAVCMSQGQSQFAECMVTHTWSSLFVDLVAAVVSDALHCAEYKSIAEGLAEGHHEVLRRKLDACGTLHQTYWICAFCINQHSSICGGFAPEPSTCTSAHAKWDAARRDTATGEIFALCDCRQPKFFNDCPDECELNKFDHMMALLHTEVQGFRHLVVVDREFEVFSRVWCVAELVEANFSQIKQTVQLCSCIGLRDDAEDLELYLRLATLTVAKAAASRPEDKDAILARIPCIPEFDAQLQAVIFGEYGLLNRRFVGCGVVEAAANTARRLRALRRRSNSFI